MKRVKVQIDEDGSVEVETSGVAGPACKALSADIEKALGSSISTQTKPEMYQQQGAAQGASATSGH